MVHKEFVTDVHKANDGFSPTAYKPPSFVWAILPVKPLAESKSRLSHLLEAKQRSDLIFAFLHQTLTVLSQVRSINRILVVSSDPAVLTAAAEDGADILDEGEATGLNIAVNKATRLATDNQAKAALILPVDLPFLTVNDVELLIQSNTLSDGSGNPNIATMVVCPDNKNEGTNAIFINLPTIFNFQYGVDSLKLHLKEAERLGLSTIIYRTPHWGFDLDTEIDWYKYQQMIGVKDAANISTASPI